MCFFKICFPNYSVKFVEMKGNVANNLGVPDIKVYGIRYSFLFILVSDYYMRS